MAMNKSLVFLMLMLFMSFSRKVNSADSLSFTYNFWDSKAEDLIYQGDTHVASISVLRLTKTNNNGEPQKSSAGRVLYSTPIRIYDNNPKTRRLIRFETSFSFIITDSAKNTPPADGIAIFFASPSNASSIPSGANGGLLGLFNPNTAFDATKNKIVAVEFDTYPTPQVKDPNHQHIGIDVNTIVSSAYTRWESKSGKVVNARVTYDPEAEKLTAVASYPGGASYSVSHNVDLRKVLPEWVMLGISSATGAEVATHDIISWSVIANLQSVPNLMQENETFIAL